MRSFMTLVESAVGGLDGSHNAVAAGRPARPDPAQQPQMRDLMHMLGDTHDMDEGEQEDVHGGADEPDSLPSVVGKAMHDAGMNVEPKWHQIQHLPSFMRTSLTALAQQVVASHTDTPVDQLQVLSDHVNSDVEMTALMTWVKRNGEKDEDTQSKFDASAGTDYVSDSQIWSAEGFTFMLVRDQMGQYVFAWPGSGHAGELAARI